MKNQKFFSLAATATFALTNVLFYALLVRSFSTETMRIWVLFLVLISFIEMARQGMVNNGMVRLLASKEGQNKEVLGAGLILSIGTSLLGLALAFGLAFPLGQLWDSPMLPELCMAYVPVGLAWAVYKWKESSLTAQGRFDAVFFAAIVYGSVLIGGFFILKNEATVGLFSAIHLQTLASAAAACTLIFPKKNRAVLGLHSRKTMLELMDFGRFNMGSNVLSMLFNKMDILLIGTLLPNASVVLYDAATRVFNWLDLPMHGVAAVIYPKLCAAFGKKDVSDAQSVYADGIMQLLLISLPAVVFTLLAAPLLLELLAGTAYIDAANILRILVLATLIKPWGRLAGMALDASRKPKVNFYLLAFSAASNLVLNLLFIHLFGLLGAALATVLAIWATVGLGQWIVGKEVEVQHIQILKEIPKNYFQILRKMAVKNHLGGVQHR